MRNQKLIDHEHMMDKLPVGGPKFSTFTLDQKLQCLKDQLVTQAQHMARTVELINLYEGEEQ